MSVSGYRMSISVARNPNAIDSPSLRWLGRHRRRVILVAVVLGTTIGVGAAPTLWPNLWRLIGYESGAWCGRSLTPSVLTESLGLGRQFLLKNQKPEGNFNYEYDWQTGKFTPGDSQVRQAGAAWGMALVYHADPDDETGRAMRKALAFFERNSALTADDARYIIYPGAERGATGTVALCALAHVDFLRGAKGRIPEVEYARYRAHLGQYLKFLVAAMADDGSWHSGYDLKDGKPGVPSSSYFDGEALLAMIKAAKYLDFAGLDGPIRKGADSGYRRNAVDARKVDPDSPITKGYFQWSSMAFYEMATSGWADTTKYGDYTIELADWMIDVHNTLWRKRNTGYAYEGIIHAYQLASERQDREHAGKFACVTDIGLEKLTSWQVGSPINNIYIRMGDPDAPLAVGGVQNHARKSTLRIDVTQHQMHAVILALRYIYGQQAVE